MNKKILLSAAIVFMLMLIGIFSNNAYAMTVDGITGGLNKTTNGTNWGIEVQLPQKSDPAEIATLTNDKVKGIIEKLKSDLLPKTLFDDVDLTSKVTIPEGKVGTGSEVSVLNEKITVVLDGDVTGDGIVAENDARNVLMYSNNKITDKMSSLVNQKAADVAGNNNGIDEMDARSILRFSNALEGFKKEIKDVVTTNYAATLNGKDITVEVSEAAKSEKVVNLANRVLNEFIKIANGYQEENTAQTILNLVKNKMNKANINELKFTISTPESLGISKEITINSSTDVSQLWAKYNNVINNDTYKNTTVIGLSVLSPINCKLTATKSDSENEEVLAEYNITVKEAASKLPQSGN